MITDKPVSTPKELAWAAHDIVIGGFFGFAIGMVVGMFTTSRISGDHWIQIWGPAVAFSVLTILVLRHFRSRDTAKPGWLRVGVWVVGILAVGFIAMIIWALSNFE